MEHPKIKYPCWWTYALIGPDEEELRLVVGALTKNSKHHVKFSNESEHKRYVSLHVEVWVADEDERNHLFNAFKAHPHVRMVL